VGLKNPKVNFGFATHSVSEPLPEEFLGVGLVLATTKERPLLSHRLPGQSVLRRYHSGHRLDRTRQASKIWSPLFKSTLAAIAGLLIH